MTEAVLKRKDGLNFFRFFPKVRANIDKAIESGELKTINYKGETPLPKIENSVYSVSKHRPNPVVIARHLRSPLAGAFSKAYHDFAPK